MAELFEVAKARGAKRANAIFFHGLDGDAYTTWQADKKDRATFWPAWLAQDIEGLSVYSVGYEAPVSKWHGYAMNFPDQATNALSRLVAESTLVNGTFALVGHSLGGLFITQILRTAQSKARYDEKVASFLGRVKKIVLLGLPEALADIAVTVETWRILTRPTEATLYHKRNHPYSRDLNLWYRDWANSRNISHLILAEAKPWPIASMTVRPDWDDPGLVNADVVPVSANPLTICKPIDRTNETYVLIRTFIERLAEQSEELQGERKGSTAEREKDTTENWGEASNSDLSVSKGTDVLPRPVFKGFFSYSHRDAEVDPSIVEAFSLELEKRVDANLVNAKFEIWRDKEKLRLGDNWDQSIETAIKSAHVLIILLTPKWISSDYCRKEFETFERAHSKGYVIPIYARDIDSQVRHLENNQKDLLDRLKRIQYQQVIPQKFARPSDGERIELIEGVANPVFAMLDHLRTK